MVCPMASAKLIAPSTIHLLPISNKPSPTVINTICVNQNRAEDCVAGNGFAGSRFVLRLCSNVGFFRLCRTVHTVKATRPNARLIPSTRETDPSAARSPEDQHHDYHQWNVKPNQLNGDSQRSHHCRKTENQQHIEGVATDDVADRNRCIPSETPLAMKRQVPANWSRRRRRSNRPPAA